MTRHMGSTTNNTDQATADWQQRVSYITDMMREMSRQTDPQEMVLVYGQRIRDILPVDRIVAISRRGLPAPKYRVTRSSTWGLDRNPWEQQDELPVFEGGLMGELLYGDEPRIIDDLQVAEGDPGADFLNSMCSVMAIPVFDQGVALNMVLIMRTRPHAFERERFAEQVWTSNLFGRATQTLVLSGQLKQAYETVDQEMKLIGELQRSLLPTALPDIPTMNLAVHYQPAARSGGDYYDFFPLADGCWGVMIADVSGHGSPAAVLMAVTHALAHTNHTCEACPSQMLEHVNHHLTQRYTKDTGRFVTAFFGVYDPATRRLTYACAGHNPPRLKRCQDGSLFPVNQVVGLPLGIVADEKYDQATLELQPGDQIVFYTDGVTEAFNPHRQMFGTDRLDATLENCTIDASGLIDTVLEALNGFTDGHPPHDDQTILVAKIT